MATVGDSFTAQIALNQLVEMANATKKYDMAGDAKTFILTLKNQGERERLLSLFDQQDADVLTTMAQYEAAILQLSHLWDNSMAEYSRKVAVIREETEAKHKFELGDLESKHYEKEKGVRFSKELLNLRKVESTLVRQCKFDEAGPVKARADALEDKERRAYDEASRAALQRKRAVLLSKQGDEARLFEEKVVSTQKRQQSIRVQDAVNLTQRYENTLADMLSQHTIVRRKVEAFFDRKAAAAGSASDGPVVPRVSEAVRNDAMALIKAILGVLKGTGGVVPEHLRQRLAVFSEMAAKQAAALDVSRAGDKEVDSSSVITAAIAATGQLAAQAASAHDQIKAIGGGSPAARSARSASPPPPAHHDLGSPYHFYGSGSAGAGAAPWDPPARSSPPRYLQQQQQAIIQQSQMSNVVPIYSQQQVLQYHPQQQQQQQQQQQGYPYFPQPFAHQIHPMGGHPFYRF